MGKDGGLARNQRALAFRRRGCPQAGIETHLGFDFHRAKLSGACRTVNTGVNVRLQPGGSMTESMTNEPSGKTPAPRHWGSRLAEIGIWIVAPFVLMIVGIILALIFGAPHQRVIGIFAALVLAAGGYFIWKPSPRFKVRRARAAGLIYTGLFAFIGTVPTPPPGEQPPPRVAEQSRPAPAPAAPPVPLTPEQQAEREAAEAARQAVAAELAAAEAERPRTEYVARLEREMSETTTQTFLQNTDTPDHIIISVAMFSALATVYRDGATLGLSAQQEAVRQRFKRRLIEWQVAALPELRNRYGPAMSRRVWREDMEVRTTGTAYRTIDLIWAGFAANRNIADFHGTASENFEALRFTRARYFWYRGADRWQYYSLEVPSDRDLVVSSGGRMVRLTE